MFVFGVLLVYLGTRFVPLGKSEKILNRYLWVWNICVILTTALMIFWGLFIPHVAETSIVVVGVIVWLLVVWLLGIFFISTRNTLYNRS